MSINKTYAVFGLGRYGEAVAKELVRSGADVIAVDKNEDIVNGFLESTPGYSLSDDVITGEKRGMATIFPFEYSTDGFFIAKIIKE